MQIHSAKFHTTVVTNSHCSSLSLSLSYMHTQTHTHINTIYDTTVYPTSHLLFLLLSSSLLPPGLQNPPIPPSPTLLASFLRFPLPEIPNLPPPPTILKTRSDASGSSYQEIHESVFHSATRGGREDRTESEPPLSALPPRSDHEEGKENQALPLVRGGSESKNRE